MLLKSFSVFLFKAMGWKTIGEFPGHLKKGVLVAAPHTSNWDYILAMAYFYILKIPFRYTIKKEWLERPVIGKIMRDAGAVGVKRDKNSNLVDTLAKILNDAEEMVLVVQPEGTRKPVKIWKTGFYRTAMQAKVPLILGYLDYEKKLAGLGPIFMPTGDFKKDMDILKDFYKDKKGKNPENFILDIYDPSS